MFIPTPHRDERGLFTRTFDAVIARGGEAKLVRCAGQRALRRDAAGSFAQPRR